MTRAISRMSTNVRKTMVQIWQLSLVFSSLDRLAVTTSILAPASSTSLPRLSSNTDCSLTSSLMSRPMVPSRSTAWPRLSRDSSCCWIMCWVRCDCPDTNAALSLAMGLVLYSATPLDRSESIFCRTATESRPLRTAAMEVLVSPVKALLFVSSLSVISGNLPLFFSIISTAPCRPFRSFSAVRSSFTKFFLKSLNSASADVSVVLHSCWNLSCLTLSLSTWAWTLSLTV
mmetsp:Transcript_824/g.1836  ORF Transcript_824/g.1836 Transcript_824/m.1836 type:complete len:230 (+) Transcript_824:157-846(+)